MKQKVDILNNMIFQISHIDIDIKLLLEPLSLSMNNMVELHLIMDIITLIIMQDQLLRIKMGNLILEVTG